MVSIMKRGIGEFIGSFILVFFGTGSVVVTLLLANGVELPQGNAFNIGLGILGGLGDWLAIGFAFAFAVMAAIYVFARVSGAHFNPAVTLALWSIGKFPAKDLAPYIVAQILGGLVGTFTLVAILGTQASTVGVLGACGLFGDVNMLGGFLAEFIGTYLLMITIMGVAVDKHATPGFAGLTIGLVIAGIVVTIGNISGSGINPMRTLTPLIGNAVYGGTVDWVLWIVVYAIAPILGAISAAYTYEYLYKDLE